MTFQELYVNSMTLIIAGSETTASLPTSATYLLCDNPEKLRKVQQEVRTMFDIESKITQTSVNDLTHMIAVLSEALRMLPPGLLGLPRIISSQGGQSAAGCWVPENTKCSIPHFAASRQESNYARPDDFVPERWLQDCPADFIQDKRDIVRPFSHGPRGCIGKARNCLPSVSRVKIANVSTCLALTEMRLVLAKMLWHFDFELENPDVSWLENTRMFMVCEKGPLSLRLTVILR